MNGVSNVRISGDTIETGLWVVLTTSDARKIVSACENGEAHRCIDILKRQAWWPDLAFEVRCARWAETQPPI